MKVLFYILSILAIVAGAVFSYSTIADFDAQQQEIANVQQRAQKVFAQAEVADGEYKEQDENLRTSMSEKAVAEQSIAKLQSDQQTLRRELGELDATLEEQQATLDGAKQAVAEAEEALRGLGMDGPVDMETIGGSIKNLEDQKKALVQELDELETIVKGAEQAVATSGENVTRLAERKAERNKRFRQNSMQSVVTAVDQNWGFVVIGAGKNSGFQPETRLVVQRDGRRIAELKPSSIEASQTIAEIDYDTMTPGVVIQPGDRVILSKTSAN